MTVLLLLMYQILQTRNISCVAHCTSRCGWGCNHHIGNVHKYARKEDVPEKTLFIITTDGTENASHHYTYDKVRHMIERQKERYGWEFLFLGANIDAAAEAKRFGIDESMAANYHCEGLERYSTMKSSARQLPA